MYNQPFGGNMQQQMMQNPQLQAMIRNILMQRMMQGGGQPQAQPQGPGAAMSPAAIPMPPGGQMQPASPMPQHQARQRMMPGQGPMNQNMGGYSPNSAARGNPEQQGAMDRNRFMQMLQQRMGGRRAF
jgi:hypothetical protein